MAQDNITGGRTAGGAAAEAPAGRAGPPAQPANAASGPGSPPRIARAGEGRRYAEARRLPTLTGFRFVAAAVVFFNHVGLPFPHLRLLEDQDATDVLFDLTKNVGGPAITFFFVLSGFIMTWSVRESDTPRAFWRRRIVKIFPNYAVTWALAMVLYASAVTSGGTAISNLLMLHAWVPDFSVFSSVSQPSWSMSCEALFYLSFPLLLRLLLRIRVDMLKYWIAGLCATVVAIPAVAYLLLSDTPYIPGGAQMGAPVSETQYWFVYFAPPMRMTDFVLGMLVALAIRNGRWRNVGLVWSGVLLLGSYLLCWQVPFLYAQRGFIAVIPVLMLIAAGAIADAEGRFTWFRNRTMVWLGEISFAFYLVHFIVLAYGRKVLGQTYYSVSATVFLNLAMFAFSIMLAWLLYTLVERPTMRRWYTSRRSSTATKT